MDHDFVILKTCVEGRDGVSRHGNLGPIVFDEFGSEDVVSGIVEADDILHKHAVEDILGKSGTEGDAGNPSEGRLCAEIAPEGNQDIAAPKDMGAHVPCIIERRSFRQT